MGPLSSNKLIDVLADIVIHTVIMLDNADETLVDDKVAIDWIEYICAEISSLSDDEKEPIKAISKSLVSRLTSEQSASLESFLECISSD